MSNPTAEWDKVGDRFYRKVQLYTAVFDQDFELENYILRAAPYGGAIALYRDEDKLHAYRGTQAAKSSIDIYSCAGKLIRRVNWDKGSVKGLGWSEDEKLLVITQDGTVRCYYDLQGDFTQFSLGSGAEDIGVKECRFWSTGFVALLNNNHLIAVSNYDEPRPKLLASPPESTVHSWTIIPPAYSLSRSVEVLLAIDQTIYVVDATESEDRMLQNGPFHHISVSPNGKFAALYTEDSKLWVISSDFQNKLSEYDSRVKTIPNDVQWCGNNSVILAWEDEIHMVGPSGASTKYFYDGRVHVLPDVDGVRLITNDLCEFLQKVPDVTEDVFKLGSSSPASVLLDAVDQLDKKSPKADDNIQLIRPNLVEAVDTCVKAAGHEFSIHWQKQLLKAASFGKSVIDLYNSDEFVDMCEVLRILNAVRFYEIGLPISYEQFVRLSPEKLVQRLINRHEYLLALRVSEYLRLPTDRVYVHWASQKVRVSTEDEESVCRLIVQKLEGKRGISFEEIARAAYDEGRGRLATELLNYEPRAGKQVPLLLNMEEDEIALDKAIESGDTDLVFFVLLHLKKKLSLSSFFRVINNRPVATALVESSARAQDWELLKDLYYQDDRRLDGSDLLISEALKVEDMNSRFDKLKMAQKLLQDSKEHTFQIKAMDEAQRLLKMQDAFDKDVESDLTGLSVNETIFQLTKLGHMKRAQKVQSEFKVPDKTFWWLRLRALVAKRDWTELEESAKVKKSPIGWEPFFNEILGAGNTKLASQFIPKCTTQTPADRVEMWMKCGLMVKAGEEALKAKDVEALENIKSKATGSAANEIDRMISQLTRSR
ncbi:vacuolar protein sorting-associated protein [Xylona heveae TC161]|uniref:Probable vacuolar protein sorting-associated protein 16 homolog n=1 Tax=Xylona heveae (strain CBS 132557 / TC161) TaxID=1328760 RepID=A0A165JTU9_XYLHT|nr:vacuolar protein sorting-associated protein [Xylona heveae TC161]KZF26620.1 vacuolar protein sorting-associated protein [Xylona heveae TC161]